MDNPQETKIIVSARYTSANLCFIVVASNLRVVLKKWGVKRLLNLSQGELYNYLYIKALNKFIIVGTSETTRSAVLNLKI